jgi:hypothetical protein
VCNANYEQYDRAVNIYSNPIREMGMINTLQLLESISTAQVNESGYPICKYRPDHTISNQK